MSLTFRRCETDADAEALARVLSVVYRRGEPMPPEEVLEETESGYLAFDGSTVVAGFIDYPMRVTRDRAALPCAGVAAVGVLPEARHRHVGSAMMEWSLGQLRSEGRVLSSLYAFREPFYRKFGYEVVGFRRQITVPSNRLPDLKPELPVRSLDPADVETLDPVYRAFIATRTGANLREPWQWRNRMGEKPPMIYVAGDPIEAYAWVSMEGTFWDDVKVGELAWSTSRGYRTILATLVGLCINRGSLIFHEPSDGPFAMEFLDQGVKIELHRPFMTRVLDVPGALRALKPEGTGAFTLEIDDRLLPDQRGPWRVEFDSDVVSVEAASSATLAMNVGTLAQALMGEPDVRQLVSAGRIRASSEADLASMARFLPPRSCYLMDFF
ncbi:MAG TPA: GNAT family N-acetyltransferase [Fimbriimonadaceae bacterium]|nr:GNAT family N-acetyltransferase [Fimbriimonadaceae bacterium]